MNFLIPIFLTRLLAVSDYGAFKQIDLAAGLLAPILLLSLDRSLTYYLPRCGSDTISEVSTVFWGALGVCAMVLGPLLLFPRLLEELFGLRPMALLGIAVAMNAVGGVVVLLAERALVAQGRGRIAGLTTLFLGLPYVGALLVGAALTRSVAVCIAISAAEGLFILLVCGVVLWRTRVLRLTFRWAVLRRHLGFALPLWFIGIVQTWGSRMDRLLVTSRLSEVDYAVYSAGTTPLPFVGVIPTSIRDVSAPLFSRYEAESKPAQIAALWKRGSEVTLPIFLVAAAAQCTLAPFLVPLIFTEAFRPAVPIFMVSAATTFLGVFAGVENVLRAFAAFRFLAIFAVVSLTARVVAGWMVMPWRILALQTVVQVAITYAGTVFILAYARRRLQVQWRDLLPTRGWGLGLALSAGCAACSAGLEPLAKPLAAPLAAGIMALPWVAAAVLLALRVRRGRQSSSAGATVA